MLARPQRMCQNWSCRGTRPASLCHFQSRTGPRIAAAAAERAASRRVMIISITHTFYPPSPLPHHIGLFPQLGIFADVRRVLFARSQVHDPVWASGKRQTHGLFYTLVRLQWHVCAVAYFALLILLRARAFAVCITEAGARLFFECADVHTIRFA